MNFKRSRTEGYRPYIGKDQNGSGFTSGLRPLIALSLSLCLLLGPAGLNLSAASVLAADTPAETAPPADLPSSASGDTLPPEGATAGDAAQAGKLEAPKPPEEKPKKKSSSRSRSSKSKSSSESKPADTASTSAPGSSDTSPSTPAVPSPVQEPPSSTPTAPIDAPGSIKDTPASPEASSSPEPAKEETSSKSKSKSSSRSSRSKKDKAETATEAPAEEKSSKKNRTSKSKKSKDADTASGAPEATKEPTKEAAGDNPPPKAEQAPDPKPTEVLPPVQTKDTPETEQPTAKDDTDGDAPVVKKKKTDDTASDTEEAPEPVRKPKRASSLVEADELLLKTKYEAAEDAYRSLLGEDETGDAHAGLVVALAKQMLPKKIMEAEKLMKKAKEQFGDNPNVMAAGGYVSYMHSKTVASPAKRDQYLDAAEGLSKRAVKLSPDTVIAQQTLGLVKLAQDDAEGAIPPLRRAAKMAEDPYTNTLLAEAMLKVDPHDADAKTLIDEALGMDRNYHPARVQKAFYLTSKGKHEEGFSELLSIPKDKRDSQWFEVQGDIYKAQGDGPSALGSWKEANRLDARNPEPYKHLAHYYAARGDGELAIAEFHNALEILPNDLPLRAELAELALRQDKLDVAETEYRTILSAKENDPASLLGLSRVFFKKARKDGQYPTGWTELLDKVQNVVTEQSVAGQLVKKGAKNLQEKVQLSEAEKALTDSPPRFREAHQLFSQVITSHREEPYELLSLGEQAFSDGDLKSAEEAYGYAKEINEVAPRAEQGISKIVNQRNEAKRHTELGNATWKLPEIAIDHYRQALIADPQHPSAYYGLYKLYYRLKKDDTKAIDYAHTFLEASEDSDPLRKEVEDDLFRMKKRQQK